MRPTGFLFFLIFFLMFPVSSLPQSVCVLEFEADGGGRDALNAERARGLIEDFFQEAGYHLVSREVVDNLFQGEAAKYTYRLKVEMAKTFGEILEADLIVVGSVRETLGDDESTSWFHVNFSCFDTARSTIPDIRERLKRDFIDHFSLQGLVKEVVGGKDVTLDIGSLAGVEVGDEFLVFQGENKVAEVKIARVYRHTSSAVLQNFNKIIKEGDRVLKKPTFEVFHEGERLVAIKSDPPGAILYVDGSEVGTTPVLFSTPTKKVNLRLERASFEYDDQDFDLSVPGEGSIFDGSICLVTLKEEDTHMEKNGLSLIVTTSPSNAFIYINGDLKGVTPFVAQGLEPGLYVVRVKKAGFSPIERRIVLSTANYRLNLSLSPLIKKPDRPHPSIRLKRLSQLLRVVAPYAEDKGDLSFGYMYPEGLYARCGVLMKGVEVRAIARVLELGVGVKYTIFKDVGLDLFHKKIGGGEEDETIFSCLYARGFDTPFGLLDLYFGGGLRYKAGTEWVYSGGISLQIAPRMILLCEFDGSRGFGAGVRSFLPWGLSVDLGILYDADTEGDAWDFCGTILYSAGGHWETEE